MRRLNVPVGQVRWARHGAHSAEHQITRLVAVHRDQKLAYLRRVPLFESCSRAEIVWLGRYCELCCVPAGYQLQSEGRHTHEAMILTRGAALSTCRNEPLGMIGPGDLVGDTALLRRQAATCSIRAVEEMEFVAFASQNFTAALARVPGFTAAVMRAVALRPLPHELDASLSPVRSQP